MNAGAQATQAPQLLFLHADTQLPEQAFVLVQDALQHHVWGRFDVRIQGQAKMLRVVAFFMNWRSRLTGIATGDQAMFMTRQAYVQAGGFPDQPLMEDIEMSAALKRISSPWCLRQQVLTSGRRWEQRGVWRTIMLMWRLRLAYWLGTPAEALARAYR
jgi:rSAM/selenodomain-associated transferase 2